MTYSLRCIETGEEFPTAIDAALYLGVSPGMITHHLNGRADHVKGHTFTRFKDEKKRLHRAPVIDSVTGIYYPTFRHAARAQGKTLDAFIADGQYRHTDRRNLPAPLPKPAAPMIRCVETGELFQNAAQVARSLGVTPGAVSNHMRGRIDRLKGCRYIINGTHDLFSDIA